MKDFEMYESDKKIGNIKINVLDNLDEFNKSIIKEYKGTYKFLDKDEAVQLYELSFKINNIDDIYDIVSKYKFNEKEIFDEIEKVKNKNELKTVNKEEKISIFIPETNLKYFNLNKSNISKKSLINSKVFFINKACEFSNLEKLNEKKNIIIDEFNSFLNKEEFSFMTDDEKNEIYNKILLELDKIIKELEDETKFKYGQDFLKPIKVIKK